MERIEIFIRLRLPVGENNAKTCRDTITSLLESHRGVKQVMMVGKGDEEAELNFCFEDGVKLNHIIADIIQAGAIMLQQFVHLPSSYSGIADVYDASIAAVAISEKLKTIERVIDASISNEGIVRIECFTMQLDELLQNIIEQLLSNKK
jgi:hypothetical protein